MDIYTFVTLDGTVYTLVVETSRAIYTLTGYSRSAGVIAMRETLTSLPLPVVGERYITKDGWLKTSRVQFIYAQFGV